MTVLTGLQSKGTQNFNTVTDSGVTVYFTAYYRPAVQMWFMDISFSDISINGIRVCNHPNILRQYRRFISFGINIAVSDDGEPLLINDLSSGRVEIGILTEDEVDQIESVLGGS